MLELSAMQGARACCGGPRAAEGGTREDGGVRGPGLTPTSSGLAQTRVSCHQRANFLLLISLAGTLKYPGNFLSKIRFSTGKCQYKHFSQTFLIFSLCEVNTIPEIEIVRHPRISQRFPEILVWAQQRRARELQEAMLEVLDKEA